MNEIFYGVVSALLLYMLKTLFDSIVKRYYPQGEELKPTKEALCKMQEIIHKDYKSICTKLNYSVYENSQKSIDYSVLHFGVALMGASCLIFLFPVSKINAEIAKWLFVSALILAIIATAIYKKHIKSNF